MPEIRQWCPGIPVLLVGVYIGPQNDDGPDAAVVEQFPETALPSAERSGLAATIGARRYFYTNVLSGQGVDDCFEYVRAN
jgi:hypothetical protein